MKIIFIDLARRTGFAFGDSAAKPISWSVELGAPGEVGLHCAALARQLEMCREAHGAPDLVGIEHWMPPRKGMVDKNVEPSLRLNGAVHAIVGGLWKRPVVEPYPATIRAQVCGQANAGDRRETKKMVVATVKLLGLMPKDAPNDDDRADALAGWWWTASTHGRSWPGGEFNLR